MDLAGVIKAEADPPGISRDAWCELIDRRPELVRPPAREGINPFTGEPTLFYPSSDAAGLFIDGNELGSFDWAQNEENFLLVFGNIEAVRPYADAIAKELGGTFEAGATE